MNLRGWECVAGKGRRELCHGWRVVHFAWLAQGVAGFGLAAEPRAVGVHGNGELAGGW